jgi:uncharacterized protein
MPQPDASITGAPCWIDLSTSDPERSRAFYGALFGWTAEDGGEEYGGYVTFLKDGQRIGGCMANEGGSGFPDGWSVYLATDDVHATADAATAHGGQVVVPAMDVMDLGSMVVLSDAGGAIISAWQPGRHTSFDTVDEPGTPGWFELHAREYDRTVAFYRDVFGWGVHVASDSPAFRYTTLGEGDSQRAGIMDAGSFLPEGVPAHWSVYFRVEDADAFLAKAVELGGAVLMDAEDTPYGRLAHATDPTGASFKLVAGS